MKTEERIKEELQKLKSEQNPDNANKIEVLEWVLDDYEKLDGFYIVFGFDENYEEYSEVFKGLENAKEFFEYCKAEDYYKGYLYQAYITNTGLIDIKKTDQYIERFVQHICSQERK